MGLGWNPDDDLAAAFEGAGAGGPGTVSVEIDGVPTHGFFTQVSEEQQDRSGGFVPIEGQVLHLRAAFRAQLPFEKVITVAGTEWKVRRTLGEEDGAMIAVQLIAKKEN
ncbi:MAG: hypothetical protein HOP28_09340 [Gemmatimonadales bacterium]|nr:hypothetical protein [Gemmatimonadales bacterium]